MNLFERLLLASSLAVVTALARPAAAEELKLPEGKVAVHYYRSDGSYDGWGLHVWVSSQKKEEAGDEFAAKETPDMGYKGVTWFKPLPQERPRSPPRSASKVWACSTKSTCSSPTIRRNSPPA